MAGEGAEVRVQFHTALKEYRVAETPIALPGAFRRSQLSQTINHLLEEDESKKFDFLIDGVFLRTSLESYIANNNVSTEEILKIEYVIAVEPPEPQRQLQHDDWIASLDGTLADATVTESNLFATGCYDNTVRLWNDSGESLATLYGHEGPVRSVRWQQNAPQDNNGEHLLVSGSQDESVRVWQVPGNGKKAQQAFVCKGHKGAVNSVSIQPTGSMVCSGSWDRTIKLWNLVADEDDQVVSQPKAKSSKKRRVAADKEEDTYSLKRPLSTFTGSKATVLTVNWSSRSTIYSGGEDHCIRQWDAESGTNVSTQTGSKVSNHIDVSPRSGVIASAEFDGKVRLYDPKSGSAIVHSILSSHTSPVMSVAWAPHNEHLLVSGSQDDNPNNLKFWDVRSSSIPLSNTSNHEDKVLAVAWPSPHIVLSGGADTSLQIYQHL